MDDDRRFPYALTAGCTISGLLFWLAFWHDRVLEGVVYGLAACSLLWFRYRGPTYWGRVQQHGTRREIRQFKATIVVFALIVVTVSVILAVHGVLK
jgi:hypothetical protein